MTATTAQASGARTSVPGASRAKNAYAGAPLLVRFVVRRNWLRMLIWMVAIAGLVYVVIESQRSLFPTQESRDAYALVANTPAVAALTGLPYAAGTLGGILNIKLWMSNVIALSFAVIFLVNRNGRAEEENGRTELLRSGVLGQHAYSLANWLVFSVFSVVVGLASAGAAIAQGLPAEGALLMGASYTGVALVFIGISAIAGQLAQTSRGANSIASIVLGVAYLLRAVADVNADGDTPNALSWISPIGWGQQMRSFGENLWWPFFLCLGAAVVLCGIALWLEGRRDVGAGILPDRPGKRTAGRFVRTPIGLTLRLQRGSIIGWTAGILVGAMFYGTVSTLMADLLAGDNPIKEAFIGDTKDALEGLLGYFAMANVLLVSAFALQSADVVRSEESTGRTELQWSGAISRERWALSRLVVPAGVSLLLLALSGWAIGASFGASVNDSAQGGRFALTSLAYWPSVLLVIAFVLFCAAWLPRAAAAVTWAVFGVAVLLSMLGTLFGLPDWVIDNTPFTAVPRVGQDFDWLPIAVISVLVLLFTGLGLWRLRTRDMTSA